MRDYKKIYREFFNIGAQDIVLCEMTGELCDDIHHIDERGMGGAPLICPNGDRWCDRIENLIAVSRRFHNAHHQKDSGYPDDEVRRVHLEKVNFVRRYNPFGWDADDQRLQPTPEPIQKFCSS